MSIISFICCDLCRIKIYFLCKLFIQIPSIKNISRLIFHRWLSNGRSCCILIDHFWIFSQYKIGLIDWLIIKCNLYFIFGKHNGMSIYMICLCSIWYIRTCLIVSYIGSIRNNYIIPDNIISIWTLIGSCIGIVPICISI